MLKIDYTVAPDMAKFYKQVITGYREGDAGTDLMSSVETCIRWGETLTIPTGLRISIPNGYVGLVCSRSGLAKEHGISVLNSPGIIDSGYRGEVCVILHNADQRWLDITEGMRIAQLVVTPVARPVFNLCQSLNETERGENGFGSTGLLTELPSATA